jgi:hypothetical protein
MSRPTRRSDCLATSSAISTFSSKEQREPAFQPAPRWLALLNGPDDEVPAPDQNRDTDQDRNDERRHFSSPSLFVPSDDHQLSELRWGCNSHDGIA